MQPFPPQYAPSLSGADSMAHHTLPHHLTGAQMCKLPVSSAEEVARQLTGHQLKPYEMLYQQTATKELCLLIPHFIANKDQH